jgi:hypothetical protein
MPEKVALNFALTSGSVRGVDNASWPFTHAFLTLWKDADPDIPIYKQAKAEYAKLQ